MRSVGFLFLFVTFVLGIHHIRGAVGPKNHEKVVTCYVGSWAAYRPADGKFRVNDLKPELCTHLIFAFAGLNATSWTIRSLDPYPDIEADGIGNYRKMTALREKHPGLKVTLGIGGWNEGSGNYSTLASSRDRRKTFIASVLSFLRKYNFDGLDLDWEFPGSRGGAPADKENFVMLIKELKEAFAKTFILTAAISANKATIDEAYDLPQMSKYLDYIHVMAYDYHGAWDRKVLPNAPLNSTDGLSVTDTVEYLLQKGAPADKLVLGLPMYGRTFILVTKPSSLNESPIGLEALDKGFAGRYTREAGFMGYNEICKELIETHTWKTGWDEPTSTPYAIQEDRVVVYDNPKSILEKISYLINKDLAGAMVWSIDTDDFRGTCTKLHDELPFKKDFALMRYINIALPKSSKVPAHHDNKGGKSSNGGKSFLIISNCKLSILSAITIFLSLYFA